MTFLSLLLILAGFIIGLGAVTVIDLHGFLARQSSYWTVATTRTHKITKPLIWIGMSLLILGSLLWYQQTSHHFFVYHLGIFAVLLLNGLFLSFRVSPFLTAREKCGEDAQLLPAVWQRNITISFLISFCGWWGSLLLFIAQLV